MRNLRYDMLAAPTNVHPQNRMRMLGITYRVATPQSLGDQWWFWGCEYVPEPLPEYLSELGVSPDSPHSCLSDTEKRRLKENVE